VSSSTLLPRPARADVWNPRVASEENLANWPHAPVLRPSATTGSGPTLVDLFSGAGGFSVGLAAAGLNPVLGVDVLRPSIETYARAHAGAATILGDIRRVDSALIAEALNGRRVDVVSAGVPCQGFSICNRKRHDGDQRNRLFREFIRIVREVKPRAVLLENVSTLRSAGAGSFARDIERAIADCGFQVEWRILNAADFGVPQLRRRLFFVGVRKRGAFRWPEPTHGEGRLPHVTVWDAIGDLPALESGEAATQWAMPPQTEYQRAMRDGAETLHNHEAPRHPASTIQRIAQTLPGEPMYPRFRQRIRLHSDLPSPTQVSGGIRPQFSFGHPTQPRGLSVRERCRLQSIPDEVVIAGGIVQGRVQTGNAVPPLLARAIGLCLMESL